MSEATLSTSIYRALGNFQIDRLYTSMLTLMEIYGKRVFDIVLVSIQNRRTFQKTPLIRAGAFDGRIKFNGFSFTWRRFN